MAIKGHRLSLALVAGLVAAFAFHASVAGRTPQEAAVGPVPASVCFDAKEQNPARLHAGCSAAIDSGKLSARERARALVLRGLTNTRLGKQKEAYADYTAALAIEPQNADALANRAAVLVAQGDAEGAIRDLDAALQAQPRNAIAHFNRGYAHFVRSNYAGAIADYSAALSLDPRLGWAYLNRCMTRVVSGQDQNAALGDCDAALKLMPDNPEVMETRGFVYLKLDKPDLAFAEYTLTLAAHPDRPQALYGRGLARARRGDISGAEGDKNAARKLLPDVARSFEAYGLN
jgi:tetratricopeptide (TPR) repeat protein